MPKNKTVFDKTIKSQFSAEAIAAGGGIIGLLTLSLLIYQNYLMADQTAEMIETNKEMIYQRKVQEKERYNHLIEILYDSRDDKAVLKSSYNREIREARHNAKLRTEAFHESAEYLRNVNRELDFTGGMLGDHINFRGQNFSAVNCSGGDFREANLSKADLHNSNFSDCDFYFANMSGANFSSANLQKTIFGKADLSGANLANADLSQSILWETVLKDTNFKGANLCKAILSNLDLNDADLTSVKYDKTTQWPDNFDLVSTALKFGMILVDKKVEK